MTFKDALHNDIDSVFMNTDEFAVDALYVGVVYPVQFVEQLDESSEAFYKLVVGKYEHFSGVAVGDLLVIDGVTYGIVDFKPDDLKCVMNMFLNEELS